LVVRIAAVIGGLLIVVLFAAASPLVDLDGCSLTVDTPSAVLVSVALPDIEADADLKGACSDLIDGGIQRAPKMCAAGAVVVVAAKWPRLLRRWHRAFRAGIPR